MFRHSVSRAGSVWRAVAVVISCTMVVRNSFLFSALVRTFRNVRRRDRHMAQTRVPNRGSTGSALHQPSPAIHADTSTNGTKACRLEKMQVSLSLSLV